MPVIPTHEWDELIGSGVTSYTTSNILNVAYKVLYIVTIVENPTTPPCGNAPTVAGAGITWTMLMTDVLSNGNRRLSTFYGLTSTPTPGALTVTLAESLVRGWVCVDEFVNVVPGGGGVNAIMQASLDHDAGSTMTQSNVALVQFNSADNITFGAVCTNQGSPVVLESGWTTLAHYEFTGQDGWATGFCPLNDEMFVSTWLNAARWSAMAAEIAYQAPPPGPNVVGLISTAAAQRASSW
jgi:hypothetical protein